MENIEGGLQDDQGFIVSSETNTVTGKVIATVTCPTDELAEQMAQEAPAVMAEVAIEDAIEDAVCACDTCLEEAGPDQTLDEIDAPIRNCFREAEDGLQMAFEVIADLSARLHALEERIALFNVRSSHKL